MNIVMFTNAYAPIVGGVERSVELFSDDLRQRGHQILIVTTAVPEDETGDKHIIRLPSIKEVAGTEFSVRLPVPVGLSDRLDAFRPDIVHSHHPFMLGDTALRVARLRGLPLVFTHHTLYERYTYLFSRDSKTLQRIAKNIPTEYANLCDRVIAPTPSIRDIIAERGVRTPIDIVPTGVRIKLYESGRGDRFRKKHGIPTNAFVLGYLGRVVEAKNMDFLADAGVLFLRRRPDARYLVVGDGESAEPFKRHFKDAGLADRLIMTGALTGPSIADAYAAMDMFAFASVTDTQGMVLVEALSAGVPVAALDATGARDVIEHNACGVLLPRETTAPAFAEALFNAAENREQLRQWSERARERARDFDHRKCTEKLQAVYERAIKKKDGAAGVEPTLFEELQTRFAAEWELLQEKIAVISPKNTS